ncbi:diaminopimelate epimerase, partial [Bacteroidota bacterium]
SVLSFTKLSGAGNDFILIDERDNPGIKLEVSDISNICERRLSVGADGVLIIKDSDEFDFLMEYYNADGFMGSLCGNGARCAIKYALLSGRIKNGSTDFMVNSTHYKGEIMEDNMIKFYLPVPQKTKTDFRIKAGNQLIKSSFADTGSPHVVIIITDVQKDPKNSREVYNDIDNFPVLELGKEIRYSNDFEPDGTNVNFIKIEKNDIHIRTYERGVENETLACGTGSVASAIIGFKKEMVKPPVNLITRGKNNLIVDFEIINSRFNNISLTGPAEVTFKGELILNK